MAAKQQFQIQQIDEYRWKIPKTGNMRVDGVVYTNPKMLTYLQHDAALQQVVNVAQLPGIVGHSLAMPDAHLGYGFPIGGVAAFDVEDGVISPGGVGYDINCGVRLMRSNLTRDDIQDNIRDLVAALFHNIPSGVGSKRKDLKLTPQNARKVLLNGAQWAIAEGYGTARDQEHIEEYGCLAGADPDVISKRAYDRGKAQLGTLGSGNHFVEIDYVEEIYDEGIANTLGLDRDSIAVTVHTGSRGFGYQVCDDFLQDMLKASRKYGIDLPDKQLCCAPIKSPEGQRYFSAMACAANYAFANRQIITHWVRETFERVLQRTPKELQLDLVYDVAHNIAKFETYQIEGQKRKVCVHRKGATRAFAAGHPAVPGVYQSIGQPVLIPGDMGRCSYVLVGTDRAMQESFGSTCHGAGRMLSRKAAKKQAKGRAIWREMEDQGIIVRSDGRSTLAEEMSDAYKDVSDVVDVVHHAGISRKVAKLRPLGVIKG
ncbi:RNA-splicing ligase RtcB [candidate division KSB3 bacterium]|uniref:tRNA-splicing ligase RtcB n=1 Tax=candidate division KSB3 bacterium TaxID=2044937 RepID=A0A9D5JSA5_9BACT|nr:RNA-splicing ligase RtcB [candidate division KSB3 bacterium]MBD3323089.1 RNA-splicing ligase RtcB [candidate division KSB3 bacterium]